MANAKRAANRRASGRIGAAASPNSTERRGNMGTSAGEVYTGGPGKAARGYSGYARNDPRPAASGEAPKGMKTYSSGDDK